ETERLKISCLERLCLATLDHIDHRRHALQRRRNTLEFLTRLRRLDKQHVGAGVAIRFGAGNCWLEAFDGYGVGARDDQGLARMPRVERGLDFTDHLLRWDERLVVEMAAALGKRLVLDLDCVRARSLEQADRARHIERITITGVRIDNEMAADAIADQGNRVNDLTHCDQANVGPAELRIGNTGSRYIERRESRPLGEMGGQCIIDTRRDENRRGSKTR